MAVFCKKCGAKLGILSNYGNSEKPLCYDCANKHVNTNDTIENDDSDESKFNKSYKSERNTIKKQIPRYMNPICVLALKDAQTIDRKSIRKSLKRLQAEISLSDNQTVEYKGRNITVSILHDIDAQFSKAESIEVHSTIAHISPLLAFFEDAELSAELPQILEENANIPKSIPDLYSNSFSIANLSALQSWNYEELVLLKNLSRFIEPAFIEEAYSPSEKHLMAIAQRISEIAEFLSSQSDIEIDTIGKNLKELLFDSKHFDLSVLPSVFDNELDSVSGRMRALAILIHNDFGHTKFAIQLIRGAMLLAKSPSLNAMLDDDLKTLREVSIKIAERDKKFRNDIASILKNVCDSVQEYGNEGINHSKLDEMFVDIFKPDVVNSIAQDVNKQFRKEVEDYVLRLIRLLGYQHSKTIINTFRPIFEVSNQSNNPLETAISEAKRKDAGVATRKALSGILRAAGPFIVIGAIIVIGFICEMFDSSESTTRTKSNSTNKQYGGSSHNASNSNSIIPSREDVSEDFVVVGEYRCRQYHTSKLDELKPDVSKKRRIESEEAYLNSESDAIEALAARIEYLASDLEKRYVDNTDQYEVDSYNADVSTYNQLLETHRSRVSRFNSRKAAYSSLISSYNTKVDIYNRYLENNCTKR